MKIGNKIIAALFFISITIMHSNLMANDDVLIVDIRNRPPEMNVDGDKYSGPLLDIIKEAANNAGYKVKYKVRQFKASFELLKNGKIDILPRTLCRPDRAEVIDYIGPIGYQEKTISFLVKPGNEDSIKNFDDLKKISVGVKRGTVYFKEFDNSNDIKKITAYDDDNLVQMFDHKRFTTMIVLDKKSAEKALKKNKISEYAFATYKHKLKIGNYFGITKKNKARQKLQQAIEKMVISGRVKEIYNKYEVKPPMFDPAVGFIPCH
ncbi:MAG: amino acid ABC transporter substrate-binding protein [Desulfobacteraceae bacterium]|nr:amino acid ABC transporter substrate-binding protein [Desulfobacteraceae bacterium]